MKVLITGSTGMIGGLILNECLKSTKIEEVISLVRKSAGIDNPKLREIILKKFDDYLTLDSLFTGVDAAFFCIGVYTGQVSDDLFKIITVDYAVNFASTLKKNSPDANLCLLSGAGADRTEKSKTSFALYKGMAENQISALGLNFYSFRPAYIYPEQARKEPNLMYRVSRFLYPLIKLFGKNTSIKSGELAKAMFHVGIAGANKNILENRDILAYV